MRKKAMKPYMKILIPATALYIVLPAFFLFFGFVTFAPDVRGVILVIFLAFLYFHFISNVFLPGIRAIYDLLTNKFVTTKVVHVNSFIDNCYYGLAERIQEDKSLLIQEYQFMRVFCVTNSGKHLILSSSLNHRMENQKSYTVTYGHYSKIIVSVLSPEGHELLDNLSYYESYKINSKKKNRKKGR